MRDKPRKRGSTETSKRESKERSRREWQKGKSSEKQKERPDFRTPEGGRYDWWGKSDREDSRL